MNRLIKWPVMSGLLSLLLAQTVPGAADYYINNNPVVNPGNIDATNFINNNSFTVTSFTRYETTDTRNYTNNATMTGYGGFQFDTLIGGTRFMAASFYNPGTITVASGGQVIVNATNIASPGVMDVGLNGLIQFTGQNVDLTRSTLTLEQGGLNNPTFGIIGRVGDFGANTNQNWNPGTELTAASATSSDPHVFTLVNSLSYFDPPTPDPSNPSNTIVRAVFISNPYLNVTNKVYFDVISSDGGGLAHVEWDGTYLNPATGQTLTNYLYLSNNYVLGASTNVTLVNGIPSNFQFTKGGPDPTLTNAVPPGFTNVFASGAITNPYAYTDAQFVPTSVTPGVTPTNPSGSPTNLPARIQISASRELNLALATISGQNYLSLTCTNQFDGHAGALIVSPYSDINLGVTNGLLTVSNLLQSVIPVWFGSVRAWSTQWVVPDPTSTNGGTLDFRVLLVDSRIYPETSPQIQDLTLHGTNLVISDQLNIMRNLAIDARSLTLTTNGLGAGSFEGELNLESGATLFASSLPNLLWLTNNGAITMRNTDNFGGPSPNNYQTFINNGTLSDQGSAIYASYFENSGFIANGSGNFILQSQMTILTNGSITANGDISITTGSLVASNVVVQAGRSLTLQVTNLLTDTGVANGNNWSVGASSLVGLNLPVKPAAGDLLGTTISEVASINKNVVNTWAGEDRGVSTSGYLNNVAVGRLILSTLSPPPHSLLTFNGAGANNAIYVDCLELQDQATNIDNSGNVTALAFNTNLVIYYAQAVINGSSVAEKLNHKNSNHLRWIPTYAGHFSSTNIVNPDGTTNTVNTALALSMTIDSNGNGIVNGDETAPFFVSGNVNFTSTLTNVPPLKVRLQWQTIPDATNYVFYKTNLLAANWLLLTNFISATNVPPVGGWPITTNVFDPVNPAVQKFYRVRVDPNSTDFYGP